MAWNATLALRYRSERGRTVSHDRHEGPLRVLAALYPEGGAVCHHVIVHPPAGIVGGDTLSIDLTLDAGAHALLTTPGATRFYRSEGAEATQAIRAHAAEGTRLEWLPLETIAHPGCIALNTLQATLAPGAEMIGWELLVLGLPASDQPFERGRFTAAIEVEGAWIERGRIDAADRRLLDSPLGLAGQRVLATAWFAAGEAIEPARAERLIDAARGAGAQLSRCGTTAPHPRVIVQRVLAESAEPAFVLLREVHARWRELAWSMPSAAPRVWSAAPNKNP